MSDGNILFNCPCTRHCWVSSGNVLHRGQQISSPTSWVSSSDIVGCVDFLIPLLAPFSLLASFCVLPGTGNSTTTLRNCIPEQNNLFFFLAPNEVAVRFLAFCGIQTIKVKWIDFFSEIESCFNEIQYRVTRRRHLKQTNKRIGTSRLSVMQKIETPRHLRIKNETVRRT